MVHETTEYQTYMTRKDANRDHKIIVERVQEAKVRVEVHYIIEGNKIGAY
jgi:thioredoxin reductase